MIVLRHTEPKTFIYKKLKLNLQKTCHQLNKILNEKILRINEVYEKENTRAKGKGTNEKVGR